MERSAYPHNTYQKRCAVVILITRSPVFNQIKLVLPILCIIKFHAGGVNKNTNKKFLSRLLFLQVLWLLVVQSLYAKFYYSLDRTVIRPIGHDSWFLTVCRPPLPTLHPKWPNYLVPSKTPGGGGKENIYSLFQTILVCRRPKGYRFCAVSVWKRV